MIRLRPEVAAMVADPSLDAVKASLQLAIQLEHSTLPPYLYAWWSLGVNDNQPIAAIVRSIVMQEMGHLALASNLLNAIGGTPAIGTPATLPTYPGALPGGVDTQLTVQLAPCTRDQITNVFMAIEEPESPLDFPVNGLAEGDDGTITIGQFYLKILANLGQLDPQVFLGTPRNQLDRTIFGHGVEPVVDLKTATIAINAIMEQGEGTGKSPSSGDPDDPTDETAHYYRFKQIIEGGALVPSGSDWLYDRVNFPLNFDESRVAPAPVNPNAKYYTPEAQAKNKAFNQAYIAMLTKLGKGLNGPASAFDVTVFDDMFDLTALAQSMMWPADGTAPIGPTFEYVTPPAGA